MTFESSKTQFFTKKKYNGLGLKYAVGYVISQHQNISRSSLLCLFLKNNTCNVALAADNWLFLEAHFVTTVNNALGHCPGSENSSKNDFFRFCDEQRLKETWPKASFNETLAPADLW